MVSCSIGWISRYNYLNANTRMAHYEYLQNLSYVAMVQTLAHDLTTSYNLDVAEPVLRAALETLALKRGYPVSDALVTYAYVDATGRFPGYD